MRSTELWSPGITKRHKQTDTKGTNQKCGFWDLFFVRLCGYYGQAAFHTTFDRNNSTEDL